MAKNLTFRYSVYQFLYFAITAGSGGFAASYLLDHGFSAAQAGTVLSLTNILSCLIQPLLGSLLDKAERFILPRLLSFMALAFSLCFVSLLLIGDNQILRGILYVSGGVLMAILPSLSNTLCAFYTKRGYAIDFGIGAGIGSLSYSASSLLIGYLISWYGSDAMILLTALLSLFLMILVLSYPKLSMEKADNGNRENGSGHHGIFRFLLRYRMFFLMILGTLFLAMCHAMAENYLISLFEILGGSDRNVGIALFIACISAVPFLSFFDRIQEKAGVEKLMRLAGLFYMLKAFFLSKASSVSQVYLIVLLQFCTYGFLFPSLYHFTKKAIPFEDNGKGQTLAMSIYTLGLALGSYAGGSLIQVTDVRTMLLFASAFAFLGSLLINLFIGKCRNTSF